MNLQHRTTLIRSQMRLYCAPQSKVRTTAYHESGGGNASNTATAMALLSRACVFAAAPSAEPFTVKLCTKIGDDDMGKQLIEELEQAGVDLSSTLFIVGSKGTTTGLTNVIVSESEQTRTCLHTPGTCGEIGPSDVANNNCLDEVFRGVVHLHTDCRHTEAALMLAREAKRRGIPVSIDIEKDRSSKAQDSLLEEADLVFTSSDYTEALLNRLNKEYEEERDLLPLEDLNIVAPNNCRLCDTDTDLYAHTIKPSAYISRRCGRQGKQVVVTKGDQGSLSILTTLITEKCLPSNESFLSNQLEISQKGADHVLAHHIFTERSRRLAPIDKVRSISATYDIRKAGVLTNVKIVDTTGAGDAFIGGFLISRLFLFGGSSSSSDSVQSCLDFASWVSGRKLRGYGSRSALPTAADLDKILGRTPADVQVSLRKLLGPFRGQSHPETRESICQSKRSSTN